VEVRYRQLSVQSRMVVGDRSLPTLRITVRRQAEVRLGRLCRGVGESQCSNDAPLLLQH
jgi:hypothetical protein